MSELAALTGPTTAAGAIGQAGAAAKPYVQSVSSYIGDKINSVSTNIKNTTVGQFTEQFVNGVGDLTEQAREQFSTDAFLRTIRRTTETIALYMPDTLAYTQAQKYDTPSAGGHALTALASAGKSALDTINTKTGKFLLT